MSVKQLVASWTSGDASPINAYIDLFALMKDGGDVDSVMRRLPGPLLERIKDIAARHYAARTEGADPNEVELARRIMSWGKLHASTSPKRKKGVAEMRLRWIGPVGPRTIAAAARFKLVSDPLRLWILIILAESEPEVGVLSARMGKDPATLKYHLSMLRRGGLVKSSHRGIQVHHELTEKGRKLVTAARPLIGKPGGRLVPT
jgi:DNA-binding transcriptional ArsR family regulator